MVFIFSPDVQAKILAGAYQQVMSNGVPLSIARDTSTGQFVAHAVGMAAQNSPAMLLNPLTAAPQLALGAGQVYQNRQIIQGIKALSASVATLQATTAVIGVGVVAVAAISAVNLWHTLKLRKEVQQLRVEVRDGFIDLNRALAQQGSEIIEQIQKVADDVEFRAHRTILVQAYGRFDKAMDRLESALNIMDKARRYDEVKAVRNTLFDALTDYSNAQLMEGVCAAAYLRRRECVWAIEQAIAMTFQLQQDWYALGDRLSKLQSNMQADARTALEKMEMPEELDFLFPELNRIYHHDLAAVEAWKLHGEFYQTLSADEMEQIKAIGPSTETADEGSEPSLSIETEDAKPAELILYEEVNEKYINQALYDSLRYMFDKPLRSKAEEYIATRAELEGLSALHKRNLPMASPLSVANLYCYFQSRDEQFIEEQETETETEKGAELPKTLAAVS